MKKAVIAIVVIGLVGAGGYGAYHHFFEQKSEEGRVSSDSENAVYVDLVSVITGYGSGNGFVNRYGGEVEPQETLKVKLESERKVKKCYVEEGQMVKEGQRLFTYDTQDSEDKIAEAEIEIEKAEAEIEIAKKSIEENEKSRAKASADEQLDYTMSILTQQNNIKQQEYEIKTKKREIEQLKDSTKNATVTAEMDGIVQTINDPDSQETSSYWGGSSDENVYITILSAGDYRIKGSVNEQNRDSVYEGMPVIVHSRVDASVTWKGVISELKLDQAEEDSDSMMYYGSSNSDSSSYAFYAELESSEGLILGQHVYIEEDLGQDEKKDGLWLDEYYLVQEDGAAYVWRATTDNVLEKHEVTLGEYDESTMKYEIVEGLDPEDYIAMPMETHENGTPVIYNDFSSGGTGMDGSQDMEGLDSGDEGLGFDDGSLGFDDGGFEDLGEFSDDGSLGFDDGGFEDLGDLSGDGEFLDDEEYYDADADGGEFSDDEEYYDADADDGEFSDDEEFYDADADEASFSDAAN